MNNKRIEEMKKQAAEIAMKTNIDMVNDYIDKMSVTGSYNELCTLYINSGLILDDIFRFHKMRLTKEKENECMSLLLWCCLCRWQLSKS